MESIPRPPSDFGSVENHWREPSRLLGIKTYLNTGVDLVCTLHQKVKTLLSMHCCFSKVRHQTCQNYIMDKYITTISLWPLRLKTVLLIYRSLNNIQLHRPPVR